tara:strand:- start:11935 stop:12867 length:933 start_codon:yes stop_codon:yes gene_type:complete
MNIRFYETLIWLSKLGNFSKTAEKLHATQPTITARIHALEQSFDAELYVRGSKPVKLTPEGKLVLKYARQIVELESELESDLADAEVRETLRIGVIELVTLSWGARFIREVQSRYPKTAFEFHGGLLPDLMQKLQDDELDLAFVLGPQSETELLFENICIFSMSWMSCPDYFRSQNEVDIHELKAYPIILPPKSASTFAVIEEYLLLNGMEDAISDTHMVKLACVFSGATGIALTSEGVGVMAIPTALAIRELKAGTLKTIPVRQTPPNLYMSACFKKKHQSIFLNNIVAIAGECARDYADSAPEGLVWV